MDETTHRLAERLRDVSSARLAAELDSRGYDVDAVEGQSAEDASRTDTVRIGHFPDHVLEAVARDRGLGVRRRYRSGMDTVPDKPKSPPSLLKSLEDTFTRTEMESAYQKMLARRKRR